MHPIQRVALLVAIAMATAVVASAVVGMAIYIFCGALVAVQSCM